MTAPGGEPVQGGRGRWLYCRWKSRARRKDHCGFARQIEWLFRDSAMPSNWLFWILFNLFVLAMLALDLGVFHRSKHVVGFREAMSWTLVWISLAAGFAVLIYFFGHTMVGSHARPNSQLSLEFITGYLIEQSLSVDNLFIFLLIFRYFQVPRHFQHDVLFWGILGAPSG